MNRLLGSISLSALLVALAACSTTLAVTGRMEKSAETFTGAIAGSGVRGATGELTLVSSRKATCTGTFVNTSRRRGDGVLNCDDGRTGTFRIAGTGSVGNGSGELSGQRFTFSFQDSQ